MTDLIRITNAALSAPSTEDRALRAKEEMERQLAALLGALDGDLRTQLEAGMLRLTANFGPPVDDDSFALELGNYAKGLVDHPWVTASVFEAALNHVLYSEADRTRIPPIGTFVEACRWAKRKQAAAAPAEQRQGISLAEYGYDRFDRGVAIGKARMRKRKALIDAYRATLPKGVWKYAGDFTHLYAGGLDEPSEAEIDVVLREMHEKKQLKGSLEAALRVRVPVNL